MTAPHSAFTHLRCSRCRAVHPGDELQNLCACGAPLLAHYDLAMAAVTLKPGNLAGRRNDLWRYTEVLPGTPDEIVTLGEGGTPLVRLHRLAEEDGCPQLYLKDEAFNPTGSFKARGWRWPSRAPKRSAPQARLPTAGNAGGASPPMQRVPASKRRSDAEGCRRPTSSSAAPTAHPDLVDGLISDCARLSVSASSAKAGSTFRLSRSRIASKARKRSATSSSSSSAAACPAPSCIHRRRRRAHRNVEGL
jgi:threonine synthase